MKNTTRTTKAHATSPSHTKAASIPTAPGHEGRTFLAEDNLREGNGVTLFELPGESGTLLVGHVAGLAVCHFPSFNDEEVRTGLEFVCARVAEMAAGLPWLQEERA
jgi:hypothetical protein